MPKFRFVFETELETTLDVEAENYASAQDRAYAIYETQKFRITDSPIQFVNWTHNVYSAEQIEE